MTAKGKTASLGAAVWYLGKWGPSEALFFVPLEYLKPWEGDSLDSTRLLEVLTPSFHSMGVHLVEANIGAVKGVYQVRLVIYKEEGVSLADCEEINKVIAPRLDLLLDSRDFRLEISSPGTDRKIKAHREYGIFIGKYVSILAEKSSSWVDGKILESGEDGLLLEVGGENHFFPYGSIKKGKLNYTMEAR